MPSDNPKVVSFSGIDGAGKSTQISALQDYLRELGFRSTLYVFWDNVAVFPGLRQRLSLRAFKGDMGVGSPDHPISRRDKNVTSWYVTSFRLMLYLLDAYSLRVAVSGCSHANADFIIFDRYVYDELANLPLKRPAVRLFIKLLLRLIPKPDVAYIVDADPEAAHRRKPEYPLEFVRKNRNAYIELSRLIPGMTVLEPDTVEETANRIKASISTRCVRIDCRNVDLSMPCPAGLSPTKTPNA